MLENFVKINQFPHLVKQQLTTPVSDILQKAPEEPFAKTAPLFTTP